MSAVPAIRSPLKGRPASRPTLRVVAGRRTRINAAALVTLFVVVGGSTFFASSLVGHVMVEKARREGIWARERAGDARKSEALLRSRVDELTSLGAVEAWAHSHGFVAPDGVGRPLMGGAVASIQ